MPNMNKSRSDIQALFAQLESLFNRLIAQSENAFEKMIYRMLIASIRDVETHWIEYESQGITAASLGDHC